jgi:hypothetical protein
METIETFKVGNLTVRIEPDQNPGSPREWSNFGKMVCCHRRYKLGDEQSDHDGIQAIIDDKDNICLPLYLYDHSGITMNTTGFSCPWDSGQVGIIYCSKTDIRKEFRTAGPANIEKARALLRSEVEVYDQFLRGDVYGYVVEDESKNNLESCWGFYGLEYCRGEARSQAEAMQPAADTACVVI